MANFIDSQVKGIYADTINKLRQDIGRNVTVIGTASTRDCPNCWTAGHLVATPNGYIAIEDLNVGDAVFDGEGKLQRVQRTISRTYSGNLIKIYPYGNSEGLTVTPDHNMYVIDTNGILKKKMAKDLALSDFLISKQKFDFEQQTVCVPVAIEESRFGPKQNIPSKIILDEDLCWLFGVFLAEGCLNDREIYFCLSKAEEQEAKRIQAILFSRLGIKSRLDYRKVDDGNLVVCASSKWLTVWLQKNFGKGAANKHMPSWVFSMPNKYAKAILDGLIFGDGHISKTGKVTLKVISKRLIYDTQLLLAKLGKDFGIINFAASHVSYGMQKQDTWALIYYNRPRKISQNICSVDNGYLKHKIRKIETCSVIDTMVYNITVSNLPIYFCSGFMSANCSYDPVKKISNGRYDPDDPYPSGISGPIDFVTAGLRHCPVCGGKGKLVTVANRRNILCLISALSPQEAEATPLGKNYRRNYELSASIDAEQYFKVADTVIIDGQACKVVAIIPAGIGDLTQVSIYAGG